MRANYRPAATIDADAQFDAEHDPGSRLGLYLAVGPGRGRRDRAADRRHARLLRRQLGALRLAGGQPRDARLRAGERDDDRRQGLVRPTLARRRRFLARPLRAARGRRQPLCAASRLQRDLPRLRPSAEVEAAADFPSRADAIPGRRVLPRLRVPEEQSHVRARLFRRSCGRGPVRPRVPPGDVRVYARKFDRRAVGAVVCGVPRLDVRPGRAGRARSICRRPACSRSPAISSRRRCLA